jgi:hypothetical protein
MIGSPILLAVQEEMIEMVDKYMNQDYVELGAVATPSAKLENASPILFSPIRTIQHWLNALGGGHDVSFVTARTFHYTNGKGVLHWRLVEYKYYRAPWQGENGVP